MTLVPSGRAGRRDAASLPRGRPSHPDDEGHYEPSSNPVGLQRVRHVSPRRGRARRGPVPISFPLWHSPTSTKELPCFALGSCAFACWERFSSAPLSVAGGSGTSRCTDRSASPVRSPVRAIAAAAGERHTREAVVLYRGGVRPPGSWRGCT